MDSITQIALGAAVAERVLGRKVGNKAALVGAICGTLPDLDSLIPYQDAVATVTYHRSFSHSLLMLALVSPLLAAAVTKVYRQHASFREWWYLVFWVLITHPLLDFFTVYGTQLLWPLVEHPFSGSTVFIIDPAYTLPLAVGVLVALFLRRESRARYYSNVAGLSLSCAYLGWTIFAKFHIEERVRAALVEQDVEWNSLLSTPAPFNSILWRLVVMADGGYYEAYYSVLDKPHHVDLRFYRDEKALLEPIADHWPVKRLQWFTHGYYSVRRIDDAVVMSDLRMGVEPTYTFNYRVADVRDGTVIPVTSTTVELNWEFDQLGALLRRVLEPVR